jgi:hypothetical protein
MLRAYEAFLVKKGTVKPQSVPYYLKWVSDCYSSLNEPLSKRLGVEQKKQFLSEMARRHEDWQVKQADTALRLYDFLSLRIGQRLSLRFLPLIRSGSFSRVERRTRRLGLSTPVKNC